MSVKIVQYVLCAWPVCNLYIYVFSNEVCISLSQKFRLWMVAAQKTPTFVKIGLTRSYIGPIDSRKRAHIRSSQQRRVSALSQQSTPAGHISIPNNFIVTKRTSAGIYHQNKSVCFCFKNTQVCEHSCQTTRSNKAAARSSWNREVAQTDIRALTARGISR